MDNYWLLNQSIDLSEQLAIVRWWVWSRWRCREEKMVLQLNGRSSESTMFVVSVGDFQIDKINMFCVKKCTSEKNAYVIWACSNASYIYDRSIDCAVLRSYWLEKIDCYPFPAESRWAYLSWHALEVEFLFHTCPLSDNGYTCLLC